MADYNSEPDLASQIGELASRLSALERGAGDAYKTALSFAANWGNYGGALEDATYSRIGRLVVLQGAVTKTGTPASGEVIATLPSGFRPGENLPFAVATGDTPSFGMVRVGSDGTLTWFTGSTVETDYTSLSGIAFVVSA